MAKGSRALTAYAVVFAGFSAEERRKANGWLTSMNCRVTAGVTNNTTHVIASQPAWNKGHKILEAAFTENEGRAKSGDKDKTPIKIVSLTWAEDCSTNRSKKAEGPYLCERIWRKDKDGGSKAASSAGGAVKEVKTVPAMLLQETGVHVDWREEERTRRMEDEIENRKTLEKKARLQEDREEHARLHAKGAKKARNEIFTENHHLYTDSTGFKYDVMITKVDTRHNRNERYSLTIQIYESNAKPRTYATNVQFAGTDILPTNNLLASIGTNFHTAFHVFKSYFKEKTGVKWDDRVTYALERAKREKRERGAGTVSEAGTRAGQPVPSIALPVKVKDFEHRLFEYHPPKFGPRGKMSKEKMAELERMGMGVRKDEPAKGREHVEAWMSGANGAATPKTGSPAAEIVQQASTNAGEPIDLTAADEAVVMRSQDEEKNIFRHAEVDKEQLNDLVDETYPFEQDYDNFNFENFGANNTLPNTANDTAPVDFIYDNENHFTDPTTSHDNDMLENTAVGSPEPAAATENDPMHIDFNTTTADPAVTEHDLENFDFGLEQLNHAEEEGEDIDFSDLLHNDDDPEPEATVDAKQMTSFNLPPSEVQESFQPGTQDVGETQTAERGRGEFEELMAHDLPLDFGHNDAEGVEHDATATSEPEPEVGVEAHTYAEPEVEAPAAMPKGLNLGKSLLGGLNFGTSMLGKRKKGVEVEDEGEGEVAKKVKMEEYAGEAVGEEERGGGDVGSLLDAQLNGEGTKEVSGGLEG